MVWLCDSHIHLSDPEYSDDMDYILNSMKMVGIRACAVSMDNDSSRVTLDIAKRSELVLPFVGIHPEKASDDLESLVDLAQNNANTISGIGEIGLDKTYASNEEQFSRQKNVFETLLGLAEKMGKPVSVHSRKTLDEVFEIIQSYKISGFLLHWFDGSKKQLQKAMDLGCFVSYGPASVYAKDKQVMIANSDKNKILVETDGPVRFSHCFGMKSAQISFIPSVVFCVAKILGMTYEECALMLEENSQKYMARV